MYFLNRRNKRFFLFVCFKSCLFCNPPKTLPRLIIWKPLYYTLIFEVIIIVKLNIPSCLNSPIKNYFICEYLFCLCCSQRKMIIKLLKGKAFWPLKTEVWIPYVWINVIQAFRSKNNWVKKDFGKIYLSVNEQHLYPFLC